MCTDGDDWAGHVRTCLGKNGLDHIRYVLDLQKWTRKQQKICCCGECDENDGGALVCIYTDCHMNADCEVTGNRYCTGCALPNSFMARRAATSIVIPLAVGPARVVVAQKKKKTKR